MLNTTSTLTQAIHKRIDMLPDDMLEKAIDYILQVPEYPEDFNSDEVETFELAKERLRNGELAGPDDSCETSWTTPEGETDLVVIRDNLHRLAGYMSIALLDECVHVLGSTALLCIPVEPTEEEIRILRETEEEFERGEYFTWDDVKRSDV